MSREQDARERYTDTSPAYNMAGSLQRHNKELLVDILCELIKINDRAEAEQSRLAKAESPAPVPTRQKVTVNS